jgi:predicted nucleotidyltransferase
VNSGVRRSQSGAHIQHGIRFTSDGLGSCHTRFYCVTAIRAQLFVPMPQRVRWLEFPARFGYSSKRTQILQIAARHGARKVRVFGSAARGEAQPESDIDFLVDMETGRSLLDFIELGQALEELLQRKVDVLTDGGLSPYLTQRIHAEAVSL